MTGPSRREKLLENFRAMMIYYSDAGTEMFNANRERVNERTNEHNETKHVCFSGKKWSSLTVTKGK